jgi:hypothetical protein
MIRFQTIPQQTIRRRPAHSPPIRPEKIRRKPIR